MSYINEIIFRGKMYKLELIWRNDKNDKSKDAAGKEYRFPKSGNSWTGQSQFIEKLTEIQGMLNNKNKIKIFEDDKCKDCLLCDEKCVVTQRYYLSNYIWDDGMIHYIKEHNAKPSDEFIQKIFTYEFKPSELSNQLSRSIRLSGRIKLKRNLKYLRLDKNQTMILDALMRHGGYNKKYYDKIDRNIIRYSEHAGFFDVRNNVIHNIIVSGNTMRVDKGDDEIFLPMDSADDAFEYDYIFHTHPPTPKPGGRVTGGILYEFPSLGDLLHFLDHFNDGKTIGSLIMTPEGLYQIRKNEYNRSKIQIDEDKFYGEVRKAMNDAQRDAIKKYGENFTTYQFYSQIAQDKSFIGMINKKLNQYQLHVDFYPRAKDFKGNWIVVTIYMPIF